MGRIFDSLNRSRDVSTTTPRPANPIGTVTPVTPILPMSPRNIAPIEKLPTPTLEDADIPYIEIGSLATGGTIFHLPGLILTPQVAPKVESVKTAPTPQPTLLIQAPRSVTPTLARRLFTIRFRPLPDHLLSRTSTESRIASHLVAYHEPDHAISRDYLTLAREIQTQLGLHSARTVIFASPIGGCGTSTVLMNLALTLARSSQRVLTVEGHRQNPTLATSLGSATEPGLADLVGHALPFNWSLHPTAQSHLHVLPTGQFTKGSPSEAFAPMQESLGRRYDWLLVDAPADELLEWANLSDAVYLVIPDDALESPDVAPWHARLVEACKLRGYVLTQPAG